MPDFTMPSLGADMDEGTLLEWLVKPGDVVHKGDVVAVVDTSKSAVDVESFQDGVVETLLVEPGTVVPVGTPLARFAAPEGAVPLPEPAAAVPGSPHAEARPAAPPPAAVPAPAAAPMPPPTRPPAAPPRVARERRVTPFARRLAAELGVDLATVATAPGALVQSSDVRAAAEAARVRTGPPATVAATEAATGAGGPAPMSQAERLERMHATIATVMARSKREIPHFYLTSTVDLERALTWMEERNRELPVERRLLAAALMLKATALAAAEVRGFNGFWADGAFDRRDRVHLGVAVSLRGGGLVAPALHDADRLPLDEVMAGLKDLVARTRSGRLRGSELSDPTITVTNLGEQGVESVLGVIYPPQVALVGFGSVVRRPWVVDGTTAVRRLTTLTLSADHRVADGFTGSRFLDTIARHLQQPEGL